MFFNYIYIIMSIFNKTKTQIKALGLLMFGLLFLGNTLAATSTVTVTFDQAPSQVSVKKTPLKYNKNFAYSYVYDDGYGEWYDVAYRYLNGWKVDGNNTIYPWLYFTDGAGNDVPFGWWFATTSKSSWGTDLHDWVTPNYITWSQFDETYEHGWNVIHHAYWPSPVTDYLQDIIDWINYVQSHTTNHILLQHFIIPDWLTGYANSVFSWWLKSVSEQNTHYFFDWSDHIITSNPVVVNDLDIHHYAMYRKYFHDSAYTTSTIIQDVDYMAANSTGTNKLWRHAFTHRVTFDNGALNGNMSWTKWKYLMDHIESHYGKDWDDTVWFVGPQDVYEYIGTRDAVVVSTGLVWNTLTIQLNNDNVDPDFVRKSLSLLVNAQWANITSINYSSGDFENTSHNINNGLINVEWGLTYDGSLISKVESYVSAAETNRWETAIDLAQTWIDFLDTWSEKTAFQNRLNAIEVLWSIRQINLGESSNLRGIWNTYNGYTTSSSTLTNLYNTNGESTSLDISISQSFTSKKVWQTETIDGDWVYPNTVMDSNLSMYWNGLSPANGIVKLSWLNPSKLYDINLFWSTTNTQTNDRTKSIYSIGWIDKELNVWLNTQNTVSYQNLNTDANGNIYISVSQKDTNWGYGNLGAIIIQEKNGSWDFIDPIGTISYSIEWPTQTKENVIATLTLNESWVITNNWGSNTYTFTNNWSFEFQFEDLAWNTATATATVDWINKALIITSVTPSNNAINVEINKDLTIEFSTAMNKNTVENNLIISPNPGDVRYQWIGNKLYIMHDNFLNSEDYTVTLGANTSTANGTILWTSYGFMFSTVSAPSSRVWQLDFGYNSFTRWVWNELNIWLTNWYINTNLQDTNGDSTNVFVDTIIRCQDKKAYGEITNDDSGIYTDTRIYKWLSTYGKYDTYQSYPESEIMIGWLDANKTYNLKLYGNTNRTDSNTNNTTTVYTIWGESVQLQTSLNTSNEVSINNVSPSTTGTINVNFKSLTENAWVRSYLNVIVLEENVATLDYIPVPNSTLSNTIETEFINWWYVKWWSWLKTVSASTVVGKKKISFANNAGKLLVPTLMKSTNELLEVEFPQWAVLKKGAVWFVWILNYPKFMDTSNVSSLENIAAAVSIWDWTTDTISIKDQSDQDLSATIRMPAPGANIGDSVEVYYSQNGGSSWSLHGNYTVINIWWESYVEFTTTHFTDFAVVVDGWDFTGSFVINNDASSTSSQSVTLNMTTSPSATHMRFANDSPSGWSSWEVYNNTKIWTLSAGTWTKTVYVQFDADDDQVSDVQTSDTIYFGENGGWDSNAMITVTLDAGTNSCELDPYAFTSTWASAIDVDLWTITNKLSCTFYRSISAQVTIQQQVLDGAVYTDEIPTSAVTISSTVFTNTGSLTYTTALPAATTYGTAANLYLVNAEEIGTTSADLTVGLIVPWGTTADSYAGNLVITVPNA